MDRASFLTGEFRHALDDRGRVAVPARFRGRLAAGATLSRWLDRCLGLFPQDEWEDLAGKLRALPLTNPRAREFARFMSSGAVEVELDRAGTRASAPVPARVRRHRRGRGGGGGALNRLEIWSPAAWQPYRAKIEDEPEALAEHLADLGI